MVIILTRLYSLPDFLTDWLIDPMHLLKIFYVAETVLADFFIFNLFISIVNIPAIAWDCRLYNSGS